MGPIYAAFTTYHSNKFVYAREGGFASRQGRSCCGGRHQQNRPIRCQICRGEGHYTSSCRDRYSHSSNAANLVEVFTSCSLNNNQASYWYMDTGATAHMINDIAQLDKIDMYTDKDCVVVDNGASLLIYNIGTLSHTPSFTLKDVLYVLGLTKNLISISKLTSDFLFSITFTNDHFIIQNQVIRKEVATGRHDNGFNVLERGYQSLISIFSNNYPRASFDVWHARLGHVSHFIISPLNKKCILCMTSLLPTPIICSSF